MRDGGNKIVNRLLLARYHRNVSLMHALQEVSALPEPLAVPGTATTKPSSPGSWL